MLLIARRIGESVRIGEDVEAKIVSASRWRVVVEICAPPSLRILGLNAGEDVKPRGAGPEPALRAANETIRQRRFNVAPR